MAAATTTGEIRSTPFAAALSERYLSYALSTIMARSLPDVRDGLKPVHRRLLHAMRQLHLDPAQGFKKCARIVGDVMGKYHPHGDAAIYDALVRLAQEFAARYPLVDGQGNFGNVDGDNAAAMRYTEARMTAVAELLLEGIDEDAVDFRATYDGEGEEPVVLPANFPNLLANGAQGIAVGMATSIPPHNVGELADALLHLIDHREARIDTLVRFIPGPDLPTGGVLVEPRASIVAAYASGRGSIRLRARWRKEALKGGVYQVVVTEIPYQVQKARLIERIAELLQERKLALLADVRDESADDIRLVLEPKSRNVDPEVLMETLFRQTELEVRIGLNMNVLEGGLTPKVMSLREVLCAYLDHRMDVLVRRSKFRLGKIEERLEILDGFRIAYLNLDKVIRLIREEDEPKPVMMRRFKLSDVQAEAILNMRLRALRRLEEIAIKEEHKKLSAERAELKALIKDEGKRWKRIGEELKALKLRFGPKTALGKRRTEIGTAPAVEEVPLEAYLEREPITVICSEKGWIRSVKGHLADASELKYKEGDRGKFVIPAESTDKLLIFATNGRFYTVGCDKLPGGRGFGEPLRLMIELENDQDLVHMRVYKPEEKLVVASHDGRGFVVKAEDAFAQTRAGKQVLNLEPGTEAAACAVVAGDWLAVLGENRKLLLFKLEEVPEMARGRGVILQKYKQGGLSDVKCFELEEGLTCRTGERSRSFTKAELKDWIGTRAQAGRLPPAGFPRALKFE
ncbi:MAG TPA: DNA topoisomerase IV subunit A [Alphaproteobacteria bacterium]|nr:DNA topoisomerase IV subunit A [Alphaproteobacteria bacterium]